MPGHRKFTLTQVVGGSTNEAPPPLTLAAHEQILGRSERADYELAVPTVSRRHAAVWTADGVPHIRDLGSGHGTFVNSTRIAEKVALRQGDLISLGQEVVLLVSAVEDAEIDALEKAKLESEDSVESSLVELALTDAAPDSRFKSYLETLTELQAEVHDISVPAELLAAVVSKLPQVISCDRFLALVGGTPEDLQVMAHKLRKPDDADHWQPPSKSILRRGLLSEKPVISFDARTDKRFKGRQSVAMSNVRSAICVGMRSAEGPQGVLYADTFANAGLHSMEDGDFMQLVGDWIGARLRELRLAEELERALGALDDSLEQVVSAVAADIKSHLNRLDMIADDAENEQGQPGLANLMRAEGARLRSDIDDHLHWSQRETTKPGSEEPERPPAPRVLAREDDEEDRKLAAMHSDTAAPPRPLTSKLEEGAIVEEAPVVPDLPPPPAKADLPKRPDLAGERRLTTPRPLPGMDD
ncbi:MAG: hypothetical protein CSA65_04200 [Proteobacteria bacterium]|nr:MAG: hypothetical protein CSA65_04200 [Pseudomonadota bacterium]